MKKTTNGYDPGKGGQIKHISNNIYFLALPCYIQLLKKKKKKKKIVISSIFLSFFFFSK